ncbi:MAG: FtsW/RodA/SpoVE family cell cycle protein [Bryobacterales bacterium]|nr:FtsW/RodA/SpoVE family cell cycle protein [Bryobacterales bacterium]
MTTTRASRQILAGQRKEKRRIEGAARRTRELVLMIPATVAVAIALVLVYQAQTGRLGDEKTLLLDGSATVEAIRENLRVLDRPEDRAFAATRIHHLLQTQGALPNVGTLARETVGGRDIGGGGDLIDLAYRLEAARERIEQQEARRLQRQGRIGRWIEKHIRPHTKPEARVPILSAQQLAGFKPLVAVRTRDEFRNSFLLWCGLMVACFYVAHLFWRVRGFGGDNSLLALVHLLSGLGLALMVSLRDPLRDSLIFRDFAIGVMGGCALMLAASQFDYERLARRFTFVPLAAAILLAVALFALGSGPAGSDAKVNLFGFQPVEAIRILLVLFLAGYFGANWDALRELRVESGPLPWLARLLHVARYDYTLPVFAGVATSLVLFFALRDMGPALVIGCLFLALYSIARNSFRLAAFGLMLIFGGFLAGYFFEEPETVRQRTDMWLNIWDNHVRGGDQIAHSLWSFSTGALTGTGLGLGYPQSVPAGHTDLILSIFSEQFGFIGFAALMVLYVLLFYKALKIGLRAPGTYSFFLATGLVMITAVQFVVIAAGILGLAPLSGVVTPFLSYGRSSMLANFFMLGMLLAISAQPGRDQAQHFAKPLRHIVKLLAAAGVLFILRAGWYQVVAADDTLLRGTLVVNADGVRRYEYNPRIMAAARLIPKGDIFDRNGLPLATSAYSSVEAHRKEYEALGANPADTTHFLDRRHYPLGAPMFYVLGDMRSPLKRGAPNTSFEESRSRLRLQGFDDGIEIEEEKDEESGAVTRRLKFDYTELLPLLRHRWEPDHAQVRELLARPRDVNMTIDARLQMTVSRILERALLKQKKQRGAVVVMDAESGDLLASVSYPWPAQSQITPQQLNHGASAPAIAEELVLDRARYGLYPPGSSFKVVTSIAALRKNPALLEQRHACARLPDGRVGATIKGQRRPIRDDVMDRQPHGNIALPQALVVSCNAYFAQLGTYDVGPQDLFDTATLFGISVARPNTAQELGLYIHQAAYGQAEVVATPFQMARVAATIANNGEMPYGRWILDESNPRKEAPRRVLSEELAAEIGKAMRGVVTQGTGRAANAAGLAMHGKTGTAEIAKKPSHAWFIGYEGKTAFAVIVENGQYGGRAAAPIAAEVMAAYKAMPRTQESSNNAQSAR